MQGAKSGVRPIPDPEAGQAKEAGPQGASILIVEQDATAADELMRLLVGRYALVELAGDIDTAEELRKRCHFDLFVVSLPISAHTAVDWLRSIRDGGARGDAIFLAKYADLDTAIAALRAGAADLIVKPFRAEQVLASVQRCLERRQMMRESFLSRRRARVEDDAWEMFGESEALREVQRMVARVAPAASTVLVEGETGTGKELVARAIHARSGRRGRFVAVNCGSISPELLESELFGHTKGAFTGAQSARDGLFSSAEGGTIFLDEIGEMALPLQANLLRVLEQRRIRPLGADREIAVNCRVIAATNQRLRTRVEKSEFREDLFYRLNVLTITIPALRQRIEDIPILAKHFSETLAAELGVAPIPFNHADFVQMQSYHWPGNIRELKNVIERSLLLGKLPRDCCPATHVGTVSSDSAAAGFPVAWTLQQVEKQHMLRVLDSVEGNKSEAARRLGVSRKTLDRKLHAWSRTHDAC